jgi:hypothetical protein
MKKISLVLVFFFWTVVLSAEEPASWREMPLSLGGAKIKALSMNALAGRDILVGTDKGVYLTRRDGTFLTQIPRLTLRGNVNGLFIREDKKMILAATETGAFESLDQGRSWRTVFNGGTVLAVASAAEHTFIGTADGVYTKADNEEHFSRLSGPAGREASYALRVSPGGVYSLGNQNLYLIRPETRAAEILYSTSGSGEDAEMVEEGEEDEGKEERYLRAIEIIEGSVYLATTHGIFIGQEQGKKWEEVPSEGIAKLLLNDLVLLDPLQDSGMLCAGTDKGLYCLNNGSWNQVDEGFSGERVLCLLKNAQKDLFAATEKGVYVLPQATAKMLAALAHQAPEGNCLFKDYASLEKDFSREPSINEVHSMAVKYSDTDTKKIQAWHRQSRAKAFIPHVSVGIDRDTGDFLHWDTGPNPDVLQKAKERRNWDLSFTWELSDLVWSSDQTSIDSRSKLMTELREEILDQVTRIYFERRRLQIEVASCDYPSNGEKMAANMRVHELTALIDAYTGGEFSSRLNHRSNT